MEQKRNSDNYILSDADTPADFTASIESVTHQPWNVIERIVPMSKAKIRRVLGFYLTPLSFMLKHPNARNVIAWQQFFGILAAFFNRYIFHRRNLSITIMTFIYQPKNGLAGKLYYKMVNSAISSKYVKSIIVFARNEVEHYERIFPKAKGKFHFVKLGIPVDNCNYYDSELASNDYFFATGVSNRDYNFLIDVFSGIKAKLKIACPNIPYTGQENIEVLDNCFKNDMKRYLYNCKAVAIPLKDLNVSSGQLVFIQAMQFGKPIIISDSGSTRSYLENNVDAIILPNNVELWREGIEKLLNDNNMYKTMSDHNRKRALSDFSIAGLGEKIGKITMLYETV